MKVLRFCMFLVIIVCLSVGAEVTKSEQAGSETNLYSVEAVDMELALLCADLSTYYGVTIIPHEKVSSRKLSLSMQSLSLQRCLDVIAWMLSCEVVYRDGVYYIGGDSDYVEVIDSLGIDEKIMPLFTGVSVYGDKLIIKGHERDVQRVSSALKKLQSSYSIEVCVIGYEVSRRYALSVGIDIDEALAYSASWQGLLQNQFNPIQSLAASLAIKAKASESGKDIDKFLHTTISLVSGREAVLRLGDALDRPVYQVSDQGTRTVGGYNTRHTGLEIRIMPYKSDDGVWFFKVSIEDSTAVSVDEKSSFSVINYLNCVSGDVYLIGRVRKGVNSHEYKKGVPYFARLPIIGWFLRNTMDQDDDRDILYMLSVGVDGKSANGFESNSEHPTVFFPAKD